MFVAFNEKLEMYIKGKSYTFDRGTEETWTDDLQKARVFKNAKNAEKATRGLTLKAVPVKLVTDTQAE